MSRGLINQAGLYESSKKPEVEKDRLRVAGKELAIGVDYDRIDATYPTVKQEVYLYTKSGSAVLELQVNYITSSKKDVESVIVI